MIAYYNLNTKEIMRTEDYTQVPVMPFNLDLEGKKAYYKSINLGFVTIDKEMGADIYNYTLKFDANGIFTGLQLK